MAGGFSGGTAFDGNWHSVAFRRNGTVFELFVDGTRVASTTATLATGSTCNRTTLMHPLMQRNDRDTLRVAFNTPRFGIQRCQIARLWPYKQLGLLILRRRQLPGQCHAHADSTATPTPTATATHTPTPTATATRRDSDSYCNAHTYADSNSKRNTVCSTYGHDECGQ